MLDPITAAAQEATDTLLLYYAGHGLIDSRRGELHLALSGSDPSRIYTAVPYGYIRELLLDSRAIRRIVILDCCYSGRALGMMADPITNVVDEVSAEGTFILAAAAENAIALAPPGELFTAFTGELLDLLQQGLPGGDAFLDLDTIYRQILKLLKAKARPLPQKRDRNTAGKLALVRNRAHRSTADGIASASERPASESADVPMHLSDLGAGESFIRSRAAVDLGHWGNNDPPILEALRRAESGDIDKQVRRAARDALLCLGCADEFNMIRVPAGSFLMGTSDAQRAYLTHRYRTQVSWTFSESPQREIYLPEFFIDRTPVTNAQFASFVTETGYQTIAELAGSGYIKVAGYPNVTDVRGVNWAQPAGSNSTWENIPDHPVTLLAWPDVLAYSAWADKQLPSEAQWEKAARGTDGRLWPWGDEWIDGLCNMISLHSRHADSSEWWAAFDQRENGPLTTPVGRFPEGASPYGLLDCSGNICERTSDWFKRYPGGWDTSEHYGEQFHVLRGGAFHHDMLMTRTAARDYAHPLFRTFHDGLRCVVNARVY